MIITHKISMDLIRHGVSPRISVVQGDENSRAVEVYLTTNGCAWKVPGGAACVVRYKKPDGHGGVYSTMPDGTSAYSVNGNTVTVMLVPQVINVPGLVELSVAIAEGKSVAGTFSFYVNVERDPSAGLTDSADYFSFSSLEEINTALISLFAKMEIDASLKKSGLPADAAAVGAAIAGITPAQIGAAPALDWRHLKWYVMGDSLTAQDNAFTNKRYYDFVQEKTGIQVIVDGIGGTGYGAGASNGESYYDRVQNIPDDVDIVTIFGSGNDIRYAESANMEIYNTLSWLALNKPGLRVIVVPPSPWKDYNKREDPWKAYCDRLQVCALTCNFRYVSDMYDCPPFNPNFTGHMELFFTTDPEEGIHPDENGHKALAPYFYNALLEELALDESVVVSPGGSGGSGGAVDIPTALPNPHKLTFTGAVTAEYDGSEAVEVKIPEGGSGGGIEVTGASVGQTIVVKAVDDNGKPTEWETADLPSGGGEAEWKKETITLEEAVTKFSIDIPSAKRVYILAALRANDVNNSLTTGDDTALMWINGFAAAAFMCYVRPAATFWNVIEIEKVGTHTKVARSDPFANGIHFNSSTSLVAQGWARTADDTLGTISQIKFTLNTATNVFPAGCKLEVYYQ